MNSYLKHTLVFLVAVLALWNFSTATTATASCSAFGIDFSPLSTADITLYYNTYNWIIRPCGIVNDSVCANDSTANTATVCQRRNGTAVDAYNLASWNTSAVVYSRDYNSVYQQLTTGEGCGSVGPRQSTINYRCNATATTPQLISAAEVTTCHYTFVVLTNLVCNLSTTAPCTFSGVDLNPMFQRGDLNLTVGAYNWYVHMCASNFTSNNYCNNDTTSAGMMICQYRTSDNQAFGIAKYNESTIQWSIVPTGYSAGLMLTIPNGEFCSAVNANRIARVQLVCDPSIGTYDSYISGIAEVTTCVYQITVITSLSCSVLQLGSSTGSGYSLSSSWWPASSSNCVFNGFSFGSLRFFPDLTWGGFLGNVYYDVNMRMCGYVRNPQCAADSTTYNSMICLSSITNARDNWALDYFVPSGWSWTNTTYGIRYVSHLGERCGTDLRTVTVDFQCATGSTRIDRVVLDTVTSQSGCAHIVYVKTPLVCLPDNSNLPPSSTGPQPAVPDCVFQGMDFKTLNPTDGGDIAYQYNDSAGTNYTLYIHMCSIVNSVECRHDITTQDAMICQSRNDGLDSYSLGEYNPWTQNWTAVAANQTIVATVGGGELCGSTPRVTNISFICDPSYTNRTGNYSGVVSFKEVRTCVYEVVMVANLLVCPHYGLGFNFSSSTGSGNPTSSSSGSATSGCISNDAVPSDAVAFAFVFDTPIDTLPSNFWNVLISALQVVVPSTGNQLRCGSLSAGITPATFNATTEQSIATVYVLPGSSDAAYIVSQLESAVNNPTILNAELANSGNGFPTVVAGNYLTCPSGQYPDSDGTCKSPDDDDSSGLSDGAIAGIVVGSVVGGLLLLALVACCLLRTRKGSSAEGRNVEMTKA